MAPQREHITKLVQSTHNRVLEDVMRGKYAAPAFHIFTQVYETPVNMMFLFKTHDGKKLSEQSLEQDYKAGIIFSIGDLFFAPGALVKYLPLIVNPRDPGAIAEDLKFMYNSPKIAHLSKDERCEYIIDKFLDTLSTESPELSSAAVTKNEKLDGLVRILIHNICKMTNAVAYSYQFEGHTKELTAEEYKQMGMDPDKNNGAAALISYIEFREGESTTFFTPFSRTETGAEAGSTETVQGGEGEITAGGFCGMLQGYSEAAQK